jgi:hypothetical protein
MKKEDLSDLAQKKLASLELALDQLKMQVCVDGAGGSYACVEEAFGQCQLAVDCISASIRDQTITTGDFMRVAVKALRAVVEFAKPDDFAVGLRNVIAEWCDRMIRENGPLELDHGFCSELRAHCISEGFNVDEVRLPDGDDGAQFEVVMDDTIIVAKAY